MKAEMTFEDITGLYDFGSLSEFEFVDALEKRSVSLERKIKTCTTADSSWNDFQLWKAEKHDVDSLLKKLA